MASRASLNKVLLIGNLTRDPELRYTPQGNAVCTFGLATNRSWMPADGGERREETEFHRLVSWNKLAELCSQLLTKGRKVYVEGRLQTRQWQTPDGQQRQLTEIVIDDMRMLDSRRPGTEIEEVAETDVATPAKEEPVEPVLEKTTGANATTAGTDQSVAAGNDKKLAKKTKTAKGEEGKEEKKEKEAEDEDILSDLPF